MSKLVAWVEVCISGYLLVQLRSLQRAAGPHDDAQTLVISPLEPHRSRACPNRQCGVAESFDSIALSASNDLGTHMYRESRGNDLHDRGI